MHGALRILSVRALTSKVCWTKRVAFVDLKWSSSHVKMLRISFGGSMNENNSSSTSINTVSNISNNNDASNRHHFGTISGGGLSEDRRITFGYSSFQGKRATMEDFYDAKISKVDDQMVGLFGVFDGHGGSRAAEYLKHHLFDNLIKHPQFATDTKLALTVALSEDHKPNRSDERQRIEQAGGNVMWAGTWRVGGVLAVSRAFGNRLLKRFVVAEPEIQEEIIKDDVDCLVIASDGLWDVVSNDEAVSLVKSIEDPEAAARKLTETAFNKGSADNITCVVVRFNHGKDDSP
ncbi:probable protein phosphatase 2C member 13, mitochondrial isoform X2 [Cryptomeria japonica]|uniref:probable protein phosphatase 2C member 13, mitochondrial isoform X2 n=1 Tax=Cryptomeria japonica TaxID=3369 RepID=UPI0027DA429D|nr:probable protein phosphatase 2C member 13, mitochondrial isoform X2 [Cryptomeria japonica]